MRNQATLAVLNGQSLPRTREPTPSPGNTTPSTKSTEDGDDDNILLLSSRNDLHSAWDRNILR